MRLLILPLLLTLLLLLPDFYLYRRLAKPRLARPLWRALWWLPSLLLGGGLLWLFVTVGGERTQMNRAGDFFFIYLLVVLPKLLLALFTLLGGVAGRLHRALGRPLRLTGVALAAALAATLLYGRVEGYRRYTVRHVTVQVEGLPAAFDGYRIAQLSDMHLGTLGGDTLPIARMVALVNAQGCDLIAFTGDLVNYRSDELRPFLPVLSRLSAPDGIFSVLGNHDYGSYHRWPGEAEREADLRQLKEMQRGMGWQLLLNEHRLIRRGDTAVALLGIENWGAPPFPQHGRIDEAEAGCDGYLQLLLSHDPAFWRARVVGQRPAVALTLSGHTHGMQFAVGRFSPARWVYREAMGLYRSDDGRQSLYVNVGCGTLLFPFRVGAWPEVTVLTLKRR